MNRHEMIQQLEDTPMWDICIIGGGATGLGAAVDSASRGYKTVLFEQLDFASGTSSRSTKLVHGGVRYLQQGNIKLVLEALRERGTLMKNAPHLVHNQEFIVPNYKWWEKPFYGIGLKLYDKMAGKLGLGPSVFLSKEETLQRLPALETTDLRGGILYHDGQFDDARLAISLAQTSVRKGGVLLNYFPVKALIKIKNKIKGVLVRDGLTNKEYQINSKIVINATGVFTDGILQMDDPCHENIIRPSQGIHLVVDKDFLPGHTAIMIPRTDDGRVLFAVPWHDKIVLGTTDTAVSSVSTEPVPREDEIDFVLTHIGRYLAKIPRRHNVTSMFAGLRPLVKQKTKKTAALSRDHLVMVSASGLITITGGKWTTYRKMAEDVINLAASVAELPLKPCITESLKLHGHDLPAPPPAVMNLSEDDLKKFVQTAVSEEMCVTPEDFLSRRSRQLVLDAAAAIRIAPVITRIMANEMNRDERWINEQINNFNEVALHYKIPN